jgi:hypothetical protein
LRLLEKQIIKGDSDLCVCPDALSLVATLFADLCYKCAKRIDLSTWQHWQNIRPYNADTNWFAFGLRRDDRQELRGKHSSHFNRELSDILYLRRLLDAEDGEEIEYFLISDVWAMSREDFEEFQNRHVMSKHMTYHEYLSGKGWGG